jgi:hypothetical protein
LLDGAEIDLVTRLNISALEVGRELAAWLLPGVESPLREIHKLGPGHPRQGYGEVVDHDSLIPTGREDGGEVDLQKLSGVNRLVVFL